MQIRLAVAVVACLLPVAAQAQYIRISSDPRDTDCDVLVPPQSQATFYVLSFPWAVGGIIGAELAIYGGPPPSAGWVITSTANPAADYVLGDPFGSGARIGFPTCQVGSFENPVLLYTVHALNVSDTNDYDLHARGRMPPSSPGFECAFFVLCDAPVYTRVCVGGEPFFLNATWTGARPARSPQPPDGATNVALDTDLMWTDGTQTCCFRSHDMRQDLYFGTQPDPPLASAAYGTYDPGPLAPLTTYYWRVNLAGICGFASSPVWSFTTGPAVAVHPAAWSAVKELFR